MNFLFPSGGQNLNFNNDQIFFFTHTIDPSLSIELKVKKNRAYAPSIAIEND